MLIVRTYVASSEIHGMGVFAAEPLKEGTPVWIFDPVVDEEITAEQLAAIPDAVRDIALSRSFVADNGRTILSRDNGIFLNHSDRPNISAGVEGSVAVRNLEKGEELTEDYRLLPPGACRAFLDAPSSLKIPALKLDSRSERDHIRLAIRTLRFVASAIRAKWTRHIQSRRGLDTSL